MKTFAFLGINNLYDEYKKAGIAGISCGKYNGYVGIIGGDGLPLSYQGGHDEDDYDESLDNKVDVHGGGLPLTVNLTRPILLYQSQKFLPIGGNTGL